MNWNELSQRTPTEVLTWANGQAWQVAMKNCVQDPEWHAEGDVWTHTLMVVEQLKQLDEWGDLSKHEQTILLFAALFHDVAKPLTSTIDAETGRVTTPKHAVKGEHLARSILRDLECELSIREEICQIVRYHGRPAFLDERENPTHEVIRMSWLANNKLLYLFALADYRGRDTESLSRPEENLHVWKLVSEEAGCFESRYQFANDHARFLFFRSHHPDIHFVPHEKFACQVTLMAGLPGSGKDTWLKTHRPDLAVVSLDNLREELDADPSGNQGEVAQLARERCRQFLRRQESFAFNATNLLRTTRARWIDLFHDYGARIEIVYSEPPFEMILRRNRDRSKRVPEKVIRRLAERIDPPTLAECHVGLIVG